MFKLVENSVELALFNFIWMTAWREKGFQFEFSEHYLERYLIITEGGEYAGSVEIKPYPGTGELDQVAPFHRHPLVEEDPSLVAEIDKVALLPEYRRRYTSELLSAGIYSAWKRGIHYMLALLEPVFHRALRITYHVPMESVGPKTFYKGGYVIPTLIKVRDIYTRPTDYPWLNLNPQTIHSSENLQHR